MPYIGLKLMLIVEFFSVLLPCLDRFKGCFLLNFIGLKLVLFEPIFTSLLQVLLVAKLLLHDEVEV